MKRSLLAIFVLTMAPLASAGVITYTDRTTWLAALGTPVTTVDFESFVADTSFNGITLHVGPLNLSTLNGPSPTNFIDVAPFVTSGVPASFGNAAATVFVQGPLGADIGFVSPVDSFFADFLYAGNTVELTLTLSLVSGGTVDLNVPGPGIGLQSFGFISSGDQVTGILMHNSVNDGFLFDNVSVSTSAAPEPASLLICGVGGALLALYSRRRRSC